MDGGPNTASTAPRAREVSLNHVTPLNYGLGFIVLSFVLGHQYTHYSVVKT